MVKQLILNLYRVLYLNLLEYIDFVASDSLNLYRVLYLNSKRYLKGFFSISIEPIQSVVFKLTITNIGTNTEILIEPIQSVVFKYYTFFFYDV